LRIGTRGCRPATERADTGRRRSKPLRSRAVRRRARGAISRGVRPRVCAADVRWPTAPTGAATQSASARMSSYSLSCSTSVNRSPRLLGDGLLQLRLDRQLVTAIAEGHEGALKGVAV